MAIYDALKAEWPNHSGTTQQKCDQINAMTVTGSIPTLCNCFGADIMNCVVYSEFAALTVAQQGQLLQFCATQGALLGGSAAPFIPGFIGGMFSGKPLTLANLVALAKAIVTPWWQINNIRQDGRAYPVDTNDAKAAGLV